MCVAWGVLEVKTWKSSTLGVAPTDDAAQSDLIDLLQVFL